MSYYRIDWEGLDRLPAGERMSVLADMHTSIRRVIGAERARIAHRALDEHGTQAAAARALDIGYPRFNQIAKEAPMTVTITPVDPAELHHQYPGQNEPQDCYVEVDLPGRHVHADYNAEVGNAVPAAVFHGLARRYPIPALTSTAANALLEQVRPRAERMVSDWAERWDGNNMVAKLGDDAQAAEEEIESLCEGSWGDAQVAVWDPEGATNGEEAEEYGITAQTTDERLEEIEEDIRANLAQVSDTDEVVLEGVGEYLERLRAEAAEEDE